MQKDCKILDKKIKEIFDNRTKLHTSFTKRIRQNIFETCDANSCKSLYLGWKSINFLYFWKIFKFLQQFCTT